MPVKDLESRINSRCNALVKIIKAIQPIYFKSSPYDQSLMETMVGAAIWYIPKTIDAWTGKISLEAIKSFHPTSMPIPKLSEEHIFPRKLAGRELLKDKKLTQAGFQKLFRNVYGKLHYVTPLENKRLVAFQKGDIFFDTKNIYRTAKITLIKISKTELIAIKKRDQKVIDTILKRANLRSKRNVLKAKTGPRS